MKVVNIRIELKQGLPNYSSRTAEVIAIADESESLDIIKTISELTSQVKAAWGPGLVVATPELESALKKEKPGKVMTLCPDPVLEATKAEVLEITPNTKRTNKISNPLDED